MPVFSPAERRILEAIAEALIAPGRHIAGGGAVSVARFDKYLSGLPAWGQRGSKSAVWAFETAAVPFTGHRFSRLDVEARRALLARWDRVHIGPWRQALRPILIGLKSAHFNDPEFFAHLGAEYGLPPATPETPRWLSQVTDGTTLNEDTDLEADVVIVGTGAGGAPLAYELAMRGHAVLMLEEGQYFRRQDFNGHVSEMVTKMYREGGLTIALGNLMTPVWAGRTVGGTTTVNSGTCYRTPERVMRTWRERYGLEMFSSDAMDRYFTRVERILGVQPAGKAYLGAIADVIARGADRLGYVHGPLRRNAPDCDGQGLCCFGCPTGAKRSTDVSYVPLALERGASLLSRTRADKILVERGKAQGIVAKTDGGATVTVRARMTVLACGTLMTPVMLLKNQLANSSGEVGKNLSIHPAGTVLGLFDDTIDMHRGIPQGYCIEQFADEGLMLEGTSTPIDVTAMALAVDPQRLTDVMESYRHLASFAYIIQDTSRGRVMKGDGTRPFITYSMNPHDAWNMKRCIEAITEVYFAAGARSVFPGVHGFPELRNADDFKRLRTHKASAGDFDVTAYHPLGTARMGTDPRHSVIGPDHQTHDVEALYVVDGSAVPSSLGVNPQITIMAMATRAAEIMDRRLAHESQGTESHTSRVAEVSP